MGQGYSLTTLSAGSAGIDVPELSDLVYEKSLGDARFMKAVRARHPDGLVVVKVVMKPYASMKYEQYIKQIIRERRLLYDIPNALGFHRALETSSNGFLIRQHIYSSIYDRMSTRPFLEDIEKRWLAFQLLSAVRDSHARNVYHGDIKTENTLVTSWNWLYLSDFSSAYKPTFLPEDDPDDFSFYFDTSGRRTCYLAPERFLEVGENASAQGGLTWAMDIFSVGCVIAEIFLESPVFNLSQLFKYRKGEYDPTSSSLRRIEDEDIRELIAHMIQIEPESRYSADEYLNFWRRKTFPEYFYSFLHQYMHLITDPTSGQGARSSRQANENTGEADDRIDRVYYDYDKISYFLGYDESTRNDAVNPVSVSSHDLFPLHLDVPNRQQRALPQVMSKDDGTLLFLNIITSSLRGTARASSRVRACDLLLVFSEHITDEARLDRVLPFMIGLLQDPSDLVRTAAIRSVTQLLAFVTVTSPVNAYLFPEYLIPRLEIFSPPSSRKLSPLVRATYASCMASISESASRFLDMIQVLKAEGVLSMGSIPSIDPENVSGGAAHAYQDLYDVAFADLVRFFERQTKALLTDSNADVRRAFLGSVSSLCVFFGSARANDVILSHLNTYLNDKDWRLKCSFFETIVGVAVYVGATNLDEFILPLMVQALTDPEESVVEKVLMSLSTMAQLGLLQRYRVWELVDLVTRFLAHPNAWIREAAVRFISSNTIYLTTADCECIMKPLLKPFLSHPLRSFAEFDILDALKKPLSRPVLDMAITWASKADKTVFWKQAQNRTFSTSFDIKVLIKPSVELDNLDMTNLVKTEEDQQWLGRLRAAGMSSGDEMKLIAIRDYIWRMAKRKSLDVPETTVNRFSDIINAVDIGIPVETVSFDHQERDMRDARQHDNGQRQETTTQQTIADALLDAAANSEDETRGAVRVPPALTVPETRGGKASSPKISSPLSLDPGSETPELVPSSGTASISADETSHFRSGDRGKQLRQDYTLQRKGSAIDLMHRKVSASKAVPATSTSSTNAVGENDGHYHPQELYLTSKFQALKEQQQQYQPTPSQHRFQGAHNYDGRDRNVLKYLDSVYLENFPVDDIEFGSHVATLREKRASTDLGIEAKPLWKPTSSFVAAFGEHIGPINRIVVSPDHLFFLTGSDDGTIRIWDCARLEQNLAHRSRQVHRHGTGIKITSLCFVQNTHCFVSAASDGTLQLVRIDCVETAQGVAKYGRTRTLRNWRVPAINAHVVWCENYREGARSILILATNTGEIIALDLRTMKIIFTLANPVQHGPPTCFCLGSDRHWLLVGTALGCLDLWDLRFRMQVKSWSVSGASPIHRLCLHPSPPPNAMGEMNSGTRARKKLVCMAGGTGRNETTLWDLEAATCVAVYRTPVIGLHDADSIQPYSLSVLEATSASKTLANPTTSLPSEGTESEAAQDHGVRALAIGAFGLTSEGYPARPFFVTAGSDLNVRYWDLTRIERSCIVNGPLAVTTDSDKSGRTAQRAIFAQLEKTSLPPIFEQRVITVASGAAQKGSNALQASQASSEASVSKSRANVGARRSTTGSFSSGVTNDGQQEGLIEGPKDRSKPTIISEQQHRLLRSHRDTILDVAVIEYPKTMIVSVDRSGVIMVFS